MAAADDEKPIPPPETEEIAPLTKGNPLYSGIASSASGYTDILSPSDSILRNKGGFVEIYKEVLRDDQVKSTFQQRRLSVVAAPWEVEAASDSAQDKAIAAALTEDLGNLWDNATDKMLFGVFYGFSVAEIMWEIRNGRVAFKDILVRDRARFRFDIFKNLYLTVFTGDSYERMPDRKFWVFNTGADNDDEPYGMGLAHWLYWPVFFKRNDIKFWLIFLEKFGMPTATAKLPPGQIDDKELRTKALQALQAIQVDAGVVIPDGVEIELLEAARSGSPDYEGMKEAMDAAIAKIVLSQTMTTDNGSSKSQAEVHQTVGEAVSKSDADLVCESFNRGPVLWWTEWNFGTGIKPPRVYRRTEPEEDMTARATRDESITKLGYEPTEQYILETYGPGWVKSKKVEAVMTGLGVPNQQAQDFAEVAALAAVKAVHRNDQNKLVQAAQEIASKYEQILGPRVDQLLAFAESSGDYETFRKHLREMMAEAAPMSIVDPVQSSNFMSRLLGAFRGQK